MRKLAAWIVVLSLVLPAFAAAKRTRRTRPSPAHKTGSASRAAAKPAKKPAASSRDAGPKKTARAGSRKSPKGFRTAHAKSKKQGWRSGQMEPAPERYMEIQQALISKGYAEGPASGQWDSRWAEALKRFQRDQNLEASGKLTSLSLIALGLGPKRDVVGTETVAPGSKPEETDRVPQ